MTKQEAALAVVSNMKVEGNRDQMSEILVTIIVQVLSWAIPKCADWLLGNKIKSTPDAPGLFRMMMLRRHTKQAFRAAKGNLVDYRVHGEECIRSMLKTYNEATIENVKSLVAAG